MNTTRKPTIALILVNVIAAAFLLAVSCNNPQKSASASMADNPKTDSTTSASNSTDGQFLSKAAMINMEEIQLGHLAGQNGTMNDVKELGKMMEEDHTKSQSDLVALARKKSITIPSTLDSNAQNDYKKLSAETGMGFDKDFCDMMVSGHKEAIALFEKESTQANDSDIRQWAVSVLPTLHKHLDDAMTCQEKCKK